MVVWGTKRIKIKKNYQVQNFISFRVLQLSFLLFRIRGHLQNLKFTLLCATVKPGYLPSRLIWDTWNLALSSALDLAHDKVNFKFQMTQFLVTDHPLPMGPAVQKVWTSGRLPGYSRYISAGWAFGHPIVNTDTPGICLDT